jgi:hypothetical protein
MKRLFIEVIADLSASGLNLSHQDTAQIARSPALPIELRREVDRRRHALERWGTDDAFRREQAELLLQRRCVSTRRLNGISTLVMRSDSDGPAVRLAIQLLELSEIPLRYLDGDGIPLQLQERRRERSQQSREREATWSPGRRRAEVGREQFNEVVQNE